MRHERSIRSSSATLTFIAGYISWQMAGLITRRSPFESGSRNHTRCGSNFACLPRGFDHSQLHQIQHAVSACRELPRWVHSRIAVAATLTGNAAKANPVEAPV
jgi:hypothetical protein